MFQSVTKRFDPIPVRLSQETEVVPDMAYTPREIIQKFSRGEKVPLGFDGRYDSLDDDPTNDVNLHNLGDDPQMLEEDPTRDYNFDKFDFVEEKTALDQRLRDKRRLDAKRRSNAKGGEGSKRKASDEETSASVSMKRETTSGETSPPSDTKPKGG